MERFEFFSCLNKRVQACVIFCLHYPFRKGLDYSSVSKMTEKRNLGNQGESIAADYLLAKGYRIIERNWNCRFGELDIVAQLGETWVFCEVKTIHGADADDAFANLTASKAKKLVKAIYHYLAAKHLEDVLWRMDAIAVAISNNAKPQIEHGEDVLDW